MDTWGGFIVGILGALATIGSVIALVIKSRGENKNAAINAKTALDARIDARVTEQLKTAWARIDELDKKVEAFESRETRRTGAMTRILRAIARQWPSGTPGPDLDPGDIAIVEDTVPAEWIRKKP